MLNIGVGVTVVRHVRPWVTDLIIGFPVWAAVWRLGSSESRVSERAWCEELADLALPDKDGTAVNIDRPSEPQRWVRTRGSSSLIRRIATWVHPLPRGDAKLVGRPACSPALQTSNTSPLKR